jgi:DNA-binding NarL/FixJ family response regulator
MNRVAAAQVANPGSADAAGPTTGLTQAPARGGASEMGPRVLWAATAGEGGQPPPPDGFAVHRLEHPHPDTLLHAMREWQPQVLVVDARWCQAVPRPALDELRRTAPRARWILAWHDVSWPSVALLLDVDARAAVHHSAPATVWADAVNAVLDGRVWLPRGAERWLYAKALAARRREVQDHGPSALTGREAEVHGLLELGYTNKEIARQLDISPNTVKKHVAAVFEKGGLRSRRQVLG